ncbi:MAG: DMT family transporter [Dictyoglomus sp.]|jgi:transporter family protein|uniref:DMT family transporter n=1 Tax=Dictyoglomus sp. TaxID=28205 RepID=UPI003D0E2AD7
MIMAYLFLLGRIILLGYEKIVVKKVGDKSNSIATSFLFFLTATLFLLPFAFGKNVSLDFGRLRYGILSGFIYSISFVLYVKSLSLGEASLVGPLYNFNVFFLLILTTVFLREPFTLQKIVGLSLLVYGASFLSKQENLFKSLRVLFEKKETLFMLGSSFLIAIGRTIDGFVVGKVDPLFYCFFLYFVISIYQFIYILLRKELGEVLKIFKEKALLVFIAGAINAYSYLFLLIAFKSIDVSIAEPLSMLSMIITLILAQNIFKENIRERTIGVLIMILGAWILNWR